MPITIKDVAREAGVSISTVSRVINNSKPVSSEIRQRVLEVIKETGYVPNPVARSLVTKRSQIIGVIVPDISDFFIGELLSGIEEVGKIYDYDILLCNSYGSQDQEERYIDLLRSKQVAGMIYVTWKINDEVKQKIDAFNIPTVYLSKNAKDYDVYSVGIDHTAAAYDAVKYLLGRNVSKIAFMRSAIEENITESQKYKGFEKAMKEAGKEIDSELLKQGDSSSESGYKLMTEIIESGNLPEGVFATNDEMAIGIINAILDKGYKVPEDVSVIGFNDSKFATLSRPALTTIKQPVYDMGAISIRMIMKMINQEKIDMKMMQLPYEIVERNSVK